MPAPGLVTVTSIMEHTDHLSLGHSSTPGARVVSDVWNEYMNAANIRLLYMGSRVPSCTSRVTPLFVSTRWHRLQPEEAPESLEKRVTTSTDRRGSQLLKTMRQKLILKGSPINFHHTLASGMH